MSEQIQDARGIQQEWQLDIHLQYPQWTFVADGMVNVQIEYKPENEQYSFIAEIDEPFHYQSGVAPSFLEAVNGAMMARHNLLEELWATAPGDEPLTTLTTDDMTWLRQERTFDEDETADGGGDDSQHEG